MRTSFVLVVSWWAVGCAGRDIGDKELPSHTPSHIEECDPEWDECGNRIDDCPPCPVLLDLDGDGFELTDYQDGVVFNARGVADAPRLVPWTAAESDDAWLVYDVDQDGLISSGQELFGDYAYQVLQPRERPNGYAALRFWDSNSDGEITTADDFGIFSDLRLWQDRNHDGVSQSEELSTLASHGITALSVKYHKIKKIDEHGNIFRYSARVLAPIRDSAVARNSVDVFLVGDHAHGGDIDTQSHLPCNNPCTHSCTLQQNQCWLPSPLSLGTRLCNRCNGHFEVAENSEGFLGSVVGGLCSTSGGNASCGVGGVKCCPLWGCTVP